jgi:hypothetical protein
MRYVRTQDEQANRFLMTAEGVLMACFIPFVGWLIDVYGGADRVLILVGLCFLLGLTVLALVRVLQSLKYSPHTQIARVRYNKRSMQAWQPGNSTFRPA